MSRQTEVYQRMTSVRQHLPQLSKAQAAVLALWNFGVVVVGACWSTSVAVASCFGALLRWVLAWWEADEYRLARALDATTLTQRFTVLAVSVVYRGCAIPVAWVVVRARGNRIGGKC